MTTTTHEDTAAAAAADPSDAAAAAAQGAPAASEAPAAPESLLTGVSDDSAMPPADPGDDSWLPEKHRVLDAEGKLDEAASARKLADAYRHLEGKLGSGDVPPKSAEEYTLQAAG